MATKFTPAQNALKRKGELEYPKQIWYLVICLIAVATANNVASIMWAWYRRRGARGEHRGSTPLPRKRVVDYWLIPSALVGAFRIFAFRLRIPAISMTLLEVLLGCIYIVAVFTWCFANTEGLTLRYYANRSGHISAAQYPLIVAISSKNNAIQFLTGVSHEKLNILHRIVARVTLVLTWVHLWARWMTNHDIFSETWITLGLVACVAHTTLVFVSFKPIRKRFYETFYFGHLILVIVLIVTTYIHLAGARPGFTYYVWPCFIVWGLDRTCRCLRYVVNNFIRPVDIPGELELVGSDALRLTVKRHIALGWRVGQHMFLAFPSINPTQSHPFTIATLPNDKEQEIVFVIRVRSGLTSILKDRALRTGTCNVPVLMDDPYGGPPDITPFLTCVFIAGGSGVTYTLPRFGELLRRVGAGRACAQRVVFIWAIRERSHIGWISTYLARVASSLPEGVAVVINIHVTSDVVGQLPDQSYENELSAQPSRDVEKDSKAHDASSESIDSVDGLEALGVKILQGRPDVYKILENEATCSAGPVSVDVSGPEPLIVDVRKALSSSFARPVAALRGMPLIQLNVEEFRM